MAFANRHRRRCEVADNSSPTPKTKNAAEQAAAFDEISGQAQLDGCGSMPPSGSGPFFRRPPDFGTAEPR
ncbi:hypothetical protein, partial [Mesorhizobium sp. M7A.F.Ca.ET.027.02.1.1]|uniref:hypothetical protein n=1 Tax=Mesorhizobium sp. M7A.F.Ca.ET.027.02.1.1 TaxID=2496655 RepID=UPI001AED0325